ncbi:MAG TPA: hypothetical protein DFS52_07585, partial [Myxococcales bacterium]|nr:hypothetical protein [Myxococcales bacterium]
MQVVARFKKLFFDPADYELVDLLNRQPAGGLRSDQVEHLFDPYLHPRGIKELAAPIHKRIAYAVIQLLATLEAGHAEERVAALRSLREEVFNGSSSALRLNTARVLLAIMKELVKDRGNKERQLRRAHDFFAALSGRPSVVRGELKKYHLLEMPEAWNQVSFDHHVHDANSKGRKSPTHLILDAWIKGIRDLNVIYYNFIRTEAAAELTEAAESLGVKLRIGIELAARFRGKYVQLIWTPRGFQGREDFLEFLESEGVKEFFAAGGEVAAWRKRQVLGLLSSFNAHHREALNEKYDLRLEPLDPDQFLAFVGVGQASAAHLAEYIHGLLLPQLNARVDGLQERFAAASAEEKARIEQEFGQLNELVPERVFEGYLRSELNPEVPSLRVPSEDSETPALLRLNPQELVEKLNALHTGYRLTLNPTGLLPADVLELVYDLEGAITHVEIFNLKDRRQGLESFPPQLVALRRSLNSGNPTAVKQAVRTIIQDAERNAGPEDAERLAKLRGILRDIPRFLGFYRSTFLRSRIGSDSIGRAGSLYGMGLVVRETLPWAAQRDIARNGTTRATIPVRVEARPATTWEPRSSLT